MTDAVAVRRAAAGGVVERAIAVALDAVATEVGAATTTFFTVGDDGELASSTVHVAGAGADAASALAAVARWKRELREVDLLAPRTLAGRPEPVVTVGDLEAAFASDPVAAARYRDLGVVGDARLLVRAPHGIVAGVTIWRELSSRPPGERRLGALERLQPFVERAYLEAVARPRERDRLLAPLSARERVVARMIAEGATNAEIAFALQLGLETVKTHVRAILAKLRLTSRRELIGRLPVPARAGAAAARDAATASDLLAALLRWAGARIDAAAGGYAVLSGGGAIAAERAAAVRRDGAVEPDPAAEAIHAELLADLLARRAPSASNARGAVGWQLEPPARPPTGCAERAGWGAPRAVTLRLHGHVAAVAWLAPRRRGARLDDPAAVEAMRRLRPLAEAASAPLVQRLLARSRSRTPRRDPVSALSPRERAIARAAAAGASNREIAARLGIREATVKSHLTRVFVKCDVRSRAQLAALLRRR